MSTGSVSKWIKALASGNKRAAGSLWSRYWTQLVNIAKRDMAESVVHDEEDLAQSVFRDVCDRIRDGKAEEIEDRESLWRLFQVTTYHKAVDLQRRESAQKRGFDSDVSLDEQLEDLRDTIQANDREVDLDTLDDMQPPPEFESLLQDDLEWLTKKLDDNARTIIVMMMQGYQQTEIAKHLNMTTRTIQRKLAEIRDEWIAYHRRISG